MCDRGSGLFQSPPYKAAAALLAGGYGRFDLVLYTPMACRGPRSAASRGQNPAPRCHPHRITRAQQSAGRRPAVRAGGHHARHAGRARVTRLPAPSATARRGRGGKNPLLEEMHAIAVNMDGAAVCLLARDAEPGALPSFPRGPRRRSPPAPARARCAPVATAQKVFVLPSDCGISTPPPSRRKIAARSVARRAAFL